MIFRYSKSLPCHPPLIATVMYTGVRCHMIDRRIDGFFYGLFMDRDILRESQIVAANPRRTYVDGYALRIGRRATLVPASEARAYGMVFALTHDELDRLYSAPGLEQYRPEAILAYSLEGFSVMAQSLVT